MFTKTTFLIACMCLLRAQCYLDLPAGAPCTSGGVSGVCVQLFTCESAAWTSLYLRAGFEYESLPELCSYDDDDEPIYCCTDCKPDTNQTLKDYIVTPGGNLEKKRDSVSWNKCMEYFQDLPYTCRGVGLQHYYLEYNEGGKCFNLERRNGFPAAGGIGARDARIWELPHLALLGYGERQSAQWLCGGSVISERFVLTAAHCSAHPKLGPISYAALGILRRSDLDDNWNVYKLERIIVHPEYRSPSKYHDIALAQTDRDINFGRGLLPGCLDVGVQPNPHDPVVQAAGWGKVGHNKPLAETLQIVLLKPYNTTHCDAIFPPHRHLKQGYDPITQMCCGTAMDTHTADTFEGDSGGPTHYEDTCMFVIVGVTSFGRDGGNAFGTAGMYTRVRHYVPWIESIVWP